MLLQHGLDRFLKAKKRSDCLPEHLRQLESGTNPTAEASVGAGLQLETVENEAAATVAVAVAAEIA
jgi:hypothetical protein